MWALPMPLMSIEIIIIEVSCFGVTLFKDDFNSFFFLRNLTSRFALFCSFNINEFILGMIEIPTGI